MLLVKLVGVLVRLNIPVKLKPVAVSRESNADQ
jgi:hypothetical protein